MKACLSIAFLIAPTAAFSPATTASTRLSPLHYTLTEETYPSFLSSASSCIDSDTCSIESAESYLREIVRMESRCAAGTLNGEACQDVVGVSAVVAGLREKIRYGTKRGVGTFLQQRQLEFESLASSSIDVSSGTLSSAAALRAPLKPAYLAIAALYTIILITLFQSNSNDASVVPFTFQEIGWAIRDGYLPDLIGAYFKHGGLLVSDTASGLTPQEVWWSIRDGYAMNVVTDWFNNGNASFGDGLGGEFVAMTPRETWWSLRDGYFSGL